MNSFIFVEKKVKDLLMAEKARELIETFKTKPDTTTQEEPKKPRPKRKINSNVRLVMYQFSEGCRT